MLTIKKISLGLVLGLALGSCGDFDNINIDPNTSTKLDARFLLLRSEMGASAVMYNGLYNPWEQIMPGYFSENSNAQATLLQQNYSSSKDYYRLYIANLEHVLRLAKAKDPSAHRLGNLNNQIAIAETLRAFFYMHITDVFGKVPYTDALQGAQGNFEPKYDEQELIYDDLEKRLTEAYKLFATDGSVSATYDIIYRGNIAKWKKLNASIRMMMAIKLSDVAPEKGKARFAQAYADGGLQTNADNMNRPYLTEDASANLMYKNYVIDNRRNFAPSQIIINHLLELNDPRVSTIADLSKSNDYRGFTFGISRAGANAESGKMSLMHPRLYAQDAPAELVTATHIKLIEAEAALRGWITADYKVLYNEAIKLAWLNNGITDTYTLPAGLVATQADKLKPMIKVDSYLAQPEVALTGDKASDLNKIALQRWINNFNRDGIEAWSDWRRLEVPADVKPGPGAQLNKMPQRRLYDPDDYGASRTQYEIAVKNQPDLVTTRVWWDVKDNN